MADLNTCSNLLEQKEYEIVKTNFTRLYSVHSLDVLLNWVVRQENNFIEYLFYDLLVESFLTSEYNDFINKLPESIIRQFLNKALYAACCKSHEHAVRFLIIKFIDLNIVSDIHQDDDIIMDMICITGNVAIFKLIYSTSKYCGLPFLLYLNNDKLLTNIILYGHFSLASVFLKIRTLQEPHSIKKTLENIFIMCCTNNDIKGLLWTFNQMDIDIVSGFYLVAFKTSLLLNNTQIAKFLYNKATHKDILKTEILANIKSILKSEAMIHWIFTLQLTAQKPIQLIVN
jgi:hypothetical protein